MRDLRIVEADSDLRGLVRELASRSHGDDGEQLLSMYVNLDPRQFAHPAARSIEMTSAIDEARRSAPDRRWIKVLEDLRSRFNAEGYWIDRASGLLIFSRPDGEAVMVKLPRPVELEVAFDSSIHLRQLIGMLPTETWGILLCNRRHARMLVGDRDQVRQVAAFEDVVDGQHDQGGWSQKRFARHTQEQVDDHLRRAAQVVFLQHRAGMFDRLLVAAPAELRGELEDKLHDQVRRVLHGWIDVDVEHSTPNQVRDAAAATIAAYDQHRLGGVVERLRDNAGRGERAALGLDAVLQALREGRVGTLVVNSEFRQPGHTCPQGDWIDTDGGTCPVHGTALQPCGDIVEAAIERAIRQDARVITVDRADPLEPLDGDGAPRDREAFHGLEALGAIAAIVRFDLDADARSTGPTADAATS